MDPSSISSPSPSAPPTNAVPFAAEPNNHPAPPLPVDNPGPHPPYAQMIYTAIEALKEKNGSSKRAIAKYIDQVYKDQLPQGHDSLLTHHLKRLKGSGMLVMDKKSYKLPGSAPVNTAPVVNPAPSPVSRPRGRPRKLLPQPEVQPQNPPPQQQNAEPVWAALGLADEPAAVPVPAGETPEGTKRRPGRPRKTPSAVAVVVAVGQPQPGPSSATPRRRGRPPGSTSKKPGRPKAEPAAAVAVAADPSLPKRRPGRPPKNNQTQATPIPFAVLPPEEKQAAAVEGETVVAVAPTPRSRGRPRKNAYAVVVAGAGAVPATGAAGRRGRGRPPGRGRGGLPMQIIRHAGKRPVGRPRKVTAAASTSQNVANEDLRRKLEHFQSKVKESVAVLKPHFNHESPVTAIAAIQELEELGIMDLNAPFRDETIPQQQHQVPQQEPQPQQQQQQPPLQQPVPLQHVPPQQLAYQQQFQQFHLQQQYHHHQPQQPFNP